MKICAVIAARNESDTIGTVIQETKKYVDKVFVVDDGSTDDTAEIAQENGVEVIQHPTNRGPGAAVQTGYAVAIAGGFDYVVQVDADGQHDPRYIPEMLSVAQGCDMVIGSRFLNKSYQACPFVRRLGISFFTHVANLLTRVGITDVTSGYRVYKTESLRKLSRVSNRHWALEQTLEAGKKGFRIKEISIKMPARNTGKSQFSVVTYGLYPFRMVRVVMKVMLFK